MSRLVSENWVLWLIFNNLLNFLILDQQFGIVFDTEDKFKQYAFLGTL